MKNFYVHHFVQVFVQLQDKFPEVRFQDQRVDEFMILIETDNMSSAKEVPRVHSHQQHTGVPSNLVFIGKKQKNYFQYSLKYLYPEDHIYDQRFARRTHGLSLQLYSWLRFITAIQTDHKGRRHVEAGGIHAQASLCSLPPTKGHTGCTWPSATKILPHICNVSAQGSHQKDSGWSHRHPLPRHIKIIDSRKESRCSV